MGICKGELPMVVSLERVTGEEAKLDADCISAELGEIDFRR